MDKQPKAKETVHTVKRKAPVAIKDKVTQAGIKTKDTVVSAVKSKAEEQVRPEKKQQGQLEQSAESYATDQVEEKAKQTAETAEYAGETAVKKTVGTVKKKRAEKKAEAAGKETADAAEKEKADADLPDGSTESKPDDGSSGFPQDDKPTDDTKKKPPRSDLTKSVENDKNGKPASGNKKAETKSGNSNQVSEAAGTEKTETGKRSEISRQRAKERKRPLPKQSAAKDEFPERDIYPKAREQSVPKTRGEKTIKSVGSQPKGIKTSGGAAHTAKTVDRDAKRTIKTADQSFKAAEKTAKNTKKAAERTAKAAKRAEETAKTSAKAAAKATVQTTKAVAAAIKASIAAAKELIAAIASGGTTALIIIIVVCLIAAVGGTCFGIFLSNDKTTGSKMTMTEAISKLTSEHYADLTDLKAKYSYDEMSVTGGSVSVNWKDVLAVYAVKTTTSKENAYEVVTMDDVKLKLLKNVMDDMNQVTCTVSAKSVPQTQTVDGRTVTTYVTKNVLNVSVKRMTVDEIVKKYGFNEEQQKQLNELMSSEYDEMWKEIIGSSGDVLITNATYIPTDIFSWPLQSNGHITSHFGIRTDPISGEIKGHGGTDIAAPTGTPILAAADGTVIAATYNAGGYGYYVKIKHNDVFSTLYGHCSVLLVSEGQQVKQGQVIAEVGSTGYSTGPHLHFEVRINDVRVDAMNYFK